MGERAVSDIVADLIASRLSALQSKLLTELISRTSADSLAAKELERRREKDRKRASTRRKCASPAPPRVPESPRTSETPQVVPSGRDSQFAFQEEKQGKDSKRGTRLGDGERIRDAARAIAEAEGIDFARWWPEFVDYWLGIPGQRGVKAGDKGWIATWRNRCRELVKRGEEKRRAGLTSQRGGFAALVVNDLFNGGTHATDAGVEADFRDVSAEVGGNGSRKFPDLVR